jgi:hypothetical protein
LTDAVRLADNILHRDAQLEAVGAVPPSVTVAAGTSSGSFTIATVKTSTNTSAIISASYGGNSKAATLSVKKSRR